MSRAFNFSAGPAALPEPVLRQVQAELMEWQGERASVMEVSHRGAAFIECAAAAERDLRELMAVPDGYHVLFLQGGATTLSALLALNLAGPDQTADFVITGHWGEKAVENTRPSMKVNIAASSKDGGYTDIPARDGWQLTPGAAFVHYTPNETIHGVEFHDIPDVGGVPLVADVSSKFLSRPVDVSRFGVIYGGAQKNLGPSGLTIAIVEQNEVTCGVVYDAMQDELFVAEKGQGAYLNGERLSCQPVSVVEDVLIGARAICYGDPDKPAFPSATTEIFEDAMVTSLTG